jgi:enamine deaminase RidA (YjgF/YER057c/UK114 family)
MRRKLLRGAVLAVPVTLAFAGGVLASGWDLPPGLDFSKDPPRPASPPPRPNQVIANVPAGQAAPLIASGASIGSGVALYTASGTGPAVLNEAAPAGSPERYADPARHPGGGVTITEAQALNALVQVKANLASVGLRLRDVVSMRVFLDNAPDAPAADFAGFNRAFRQYFANTDLATGEPLSVPIGTGPLGPPLEVNPVRPARSMIEVGSLPVAGWLVEIEVVARFAR